MLKKIIIKNVALIDSAEIEFTDGLNVLSGETGAGKSVILESLNFVLGAKADKSLIRTGESECFVKAEFDVSNIPEIDEIYESCDFEQDDCLIIQRKFNLDGKSSIKINGETVNVSIVKKFSSYLVDIHGQSEHFHLLKNSNQLQLLDKLGGESLFSLKDQIKQDFIIYNKIKAELENLGGDEAQRLIKLDILDYQIAEIEKIDLKDGEEQELISIKQKLLYQKKISDALSSAKECLSDEGGICDLLSNITKLVNSISDLSEEYSGLAERLNNALSDLDDISGLSSSLLDELELPEYNPNDVEERLESIKTLKKKYGNDYNEINSFLENAKIEREKLENFNVLAEKLLKDKQKIQSSIYEKYLNLSNYRRDLAKKLSENTILELNELGMSKAQFLVNFNNQPLENECDYISQNGFDIIEFMFSANMGEPIKPLSLIISGGEMSRFMLSIKAQTAKFSDISTFVFDEIDSGISGVTAKVVAEKLARISKDVQVIAITHLPQISAMADNNLLIEKNENDFRTITSVKKLDEKGKITEISRLLSGDTDSLSAIKHAEELVTRANEYKKLLV